MGRSEARIFTSIWRDPAFTCLPPDAQWLYMFLLSQDDLTYCGVMPLRPARWRSRAAGMTTGRIEDALKWLEGTAYPTANPEPESGRTLPLVIADQDTGELLIRSLIRRDGVWKQPNLFKLAIDAASQIDSPRIRGALLVELRRLPVEETASEQVRTLVADFTADLEKGEPYPTPYPPENPSDYPTDEGTAKDYARAQGSGGKVTTEQVIPEPLIPRSPNPSLSRKNGTRLPDDFELTDDMRDWAAEHSPHVDAERELARFCDYWRSKPGKDGRKLDWVMTWRNWMRTAEDRQGPRERPPPARRLSIGDRALAEAEELKAQLRSHPRELT